MQKNILLTQTVQKGGCAAKVAATELRQILSQVKFPPVFKDVIVDGHLMDDAAVIQVNESLALVQTLDFFTPIVNSPLHFWTNCCSERFKRCLCHGWLAKNGVGHSGISAYFNG